MKSFLLVIAFSSLLFSAFAEDHQYEEFRVRIYHSDNDYIRSLDKLVENGIFMLDHPKVDSEFVDAYVSRRDFSVCSIPLNYSINIHSLDIRIIGLQI